MCQLGKVLAPGLSLLRDSVRPGVKMQNLTSLQHGVGLRHQQVREMLPRDGLLHMDHETVRFDPSLVHLQPGPISIAMLSNLPSSIMAKSSIMVAPCRPQLNVREGEAGRLYVVWLQ